MKQITEKVFDSNKEAPTPLSPREISLIEETI